MLLKDLEWSPHARNRYWEECELPLKSGHWLWLGRKSALNDSPIPGMFLIHLYASQNSIGNTKPLAQWGGVPWSDNDISGRRFLDAAEAQCVIYELTTNGYNPGGNDDPE
jgi:hypothetical protein